MTKSDSLHSPTSEPKPNKKTALHLVLLRKYFSTTAIELRSLQRLGWRKPIILMGVLVALIGLRPNFSPSWPTFPSNHGEPYPPLVMTGGDPYVRALMRTISASESNDPEPYSLLYGGERFADWSDHPNRCLTITIGPNTGDCTTAAGRYQFITSTWDEKAKIYHSHPEGWWVWQHYPFDPVSQDKVVYRWLNDPAAWNADIPAMLRNKQVPEVLALLSGTWTSLGYGIETNDMSSQLQDLYQQFLKEELKHS